MKINPNIVNAVYESNTAKLHASLASVREVDLKRDAEGTVCLLVSIFHFLFPTGCSSTKNGFSTSYASVDA